MCGRFTITKSKKELEERFEAEFDFPHHPRYNAAPEQNLAVILNTAPQTISSAQWGLKPKWIKSVTKSGGIINVRMENLRDKPTFSSDLKNRRCLIISDGFYEWKKEASGKQPFWIYIKNKKPFAFAGIWQESENENTFAIITTDPNLKIQQIHNRMPVILSKQEEKAWLEADDKNLMISMLDAYPQEEMGSYEVALTVNNPIIDNDTLINPR